MITFFFINSQVLVEIDNRDREYNEIAPAVDSVNAPKKRKKDSPSPIALEPCAGNKAAVLSLLVRMPTGKFTTSLFPDVVRMGYSPFREYSILTGVEILIFNFRY